MSASGIQSCRVNGVEHRYYVGDHIIKIAPGWKTVSKHPTKAEADRAWYALLGKADPTPTTALARSPGKTMAEQYPDEGLIARQLSEQYQRAVGGLWEVVKFGAMLAHTQQHLFSALRGHGNAKKFESDGEGVKGWLTDHCPEINVKTAYRFKGLAEGLQKEFKLGQPADLHRLLTSNEGDLNRADRKMREEIEGFLAGASQRQLQFRFMTDRLSKAPKVLSAREKVSIKVQVLTNLRAACQEFLRMKGLMDDDHFNTGCGRLVKTLEEATACPWSPDPHNERPKDQYTEHAHCYEVEG